MTAAWSGTADAPSLLLTVLAFVFVARTRYLPAAACIAGAVLLKQFALIALPFLAVMMLTQGAARRVLWQAAALFAVIVAVGILPFAVWDLGALWDDTIAYGAQTYRIIGYGLAGVLLEIVLDDRFGPYPSCRLPPSCGYRYGVAVVDAVALSPVVDRRGGVRGADFRPALPWPRFPELVLDLASERRARCLLACLRRARRFFGAVEHAGAADDVEVLAVGDGGLKTPSGQRQTSFPVSAFRA